MDNKEKHERSTLFKQCIDLLAIGKNISPVVEEFIEFHKKYPQEETKTMDSIIYSQYIVVS